MARVHPAPPLASNSLLSPHNNKYNTRQSLKRYTIIQPPVHNAETLFELAPNVVQTPYP